MAAIAFFAYARVRQVRFAGELFWGALFVASCISRTTIDLSGIVAPQTWALWFAAIVQGFVGIRNRQSSRLFMATLCLLAAVRSDFLTGADSLYRDGLPLHLAGVAVLSLGMIFDDAFVYWLRRAAETGWPCYPYFARDPNLDRVRSDPQFVTFMKQLKAQWLREQEML